MDSLEVLEAQHVVNERVLITFKAISEKLAELEARIEELEENDRLHTSNTAET